MGWLWRGLLVAVPVGALGGVIQLYLEPAGLPWTGRALGLGVGVVALALTWSWVFGPGKKNDDDEGR